MSDDDKKTSTWDDIKRMADEVKLKLHLAGMEAKEKWEELSPKIAEVQADLEREGSEIGDKLNDKMASLGARLRKLRDDLK